MVWYDLTFDLKWSIKVTAHPLTKGTPWVKTGERTYDSENDFSNNSAKASTSDLNFGSGSLLILNLRALCRLSIGQIVPRGEKICPWQVIADERTDGRTDHYRAPTERAPNKTTSIGRIDTVPQTGQISSLQILETVTFSSPLRLWLLNWPNIKRREMTQFGRNQKIEKISVDRDTAKGNLSWFNTVYAPRKTTVLYMMCWNN